MFRGYRRHLIASVSSDAIGALALRFVRNGLIEKLDARGALVDDNDPNIPVIRPVDPYGYRYRVLPHTTGGVSQCG